MPEPVAIAEPDWRARIRGSRLGNLTVLAVTALAVLIGSWLGAHLVGLTPNDDLMTVEPPPELVAPAGREGLRVQGDVVAVSCGGQQNGLTRAQFVDGLQDPGWQGLRVQGHLVTGDAAHDDDRAVGAVRPVERPGRLQVGDGHRAALAVGEFHAGLQQSVADGLGEVDRRVNGHGAVPVAR